MRSLGKRLENQQTGIQGKPPWNGHTDSRQAAAPRFGLLFVAFFSWIPFALPLKTSFNVGDIVGGGD